MAELKWAKEYQKIYDRSQTPSGWNSLDKFRIEEIDGLMGEVDALKAQIKRLEDSRFALAVAHTEDILTIERLTAKEKSWRRDGSDAVEESKTAQHPPA